MQELSCHNWILYLTYAPLYVEHFPILSHPKNTHKVEIYFNQWPYYLQSIYRVGQISVRQFANAPKKNEIHPGYFKLKEIQKLYQVNGCNTSLYFIEGMTVIFVLIFFDSQKDDGLPVHLKRGLRDKVLYYGILGLCGVGVASCAEFFYSSM